MASTRRQWLAGMPAAAMAAQTQQGGAARPNIVLIISDQFRWDCVGAMGLNPMNLTPNLDRMAGQGVLFRSAFCNQPVCAPARGSIFTGQYPVRHGVWKNAIALPENATTLAKDAPLRRVLRELHGQMASRERRRRRRRSATALSRLPAAADFWTYGKRRTRSSSPRTPTKATSGTPTGKPIHFSGQYRTDFTTERAQRFLRSVKSPFFLDAFVPRSAPPERLGQLRAA